MAAAAAVVAATHAHAHSHRKQRNSQTRCSKASFEDVCVSLRQLVEEQRKVHENISRLESALLSMERRFISVLQGVSMQDYLGAEVSTGTNSYQQHFTVQQISSGAKRGGQRTLTGGSRDVTQAAGGISELRDHPAHPRLTRAMSDSDTILSWVSPKKGPGAKVERRRMAPGLGSMDSDVFFGEEEAAKQVGRDLPPNWPSCIVVREELQKETSEANVGIMTRGASTAYLPSLERRSHKGDAGGSQLSMDEPEALERESRKIWKRLIVNPDSGIMQFKDFIGFIVLMHDLIVTPYLISWNRPVEGPLQTMSWAAALFWTVDLLLNFSLGYTRGGEFIMSQPQIALNYLRTRFFFDFSLVTLDMLTIVTDLSDSGTSGKEKTILRIAKLMRLLKVARLIRLFWLLEKASHNFLSKENSINMNLLIQAIKVIFALFLSCHILACIWYIAGRDWPSDTDETWIDLAFGSQGPSAFSPSFQYLTSLHWTVAQVTLGSSHVVPRNSSELLFNIVLLVTGLLAGSTFVSLFSAKIVEHTASKRDQAELVDTLQRFLRQNNIATSLTRRALNQVRQRILEQDKLGEDDVPALAMLSPALRQELLFESRLPHLMTHCIFRLWVEVDMKTFGPLSDAALFRFLLPQDELFVAGEPSSEGYYIIEGGMYYLQYPATSMVPEETSQNVEERMWLSEAALWMHWVHVGDAVASQVLQLMVVNAEALTGVIASSPREVRVMSMQYGKRFHAHVAAASPPFAEYPSDVDLPWENNEELFNPRACLYSFRRLVREDKLSLADDQKFKLEREIRKGCCAVRRGIDGDLERLVMAVAINIRLADGRVLFHLATLDDNRVGHVKMGLPEVTRDFGELPSGAVWRLLQEQLQCFSQWVEVTETTFTEELEKSPQAALNTVKQKSIHTLRMTQSLDNLVLPVAEPARVITVPGTKETLKEVHVIPAQDDSFGIYVFLPQDIAHAMQDAIRADPDYLTAFEEWLRCIDPLEAQTSWGLRSPFRRDSAACAAPGRASFQHAASGSDAGAQGADLMNLGAQQRAPTHRRASTGAASEGSIADTPRLPPEAITPSFLAVDPSWRDNRSYSRSGTGDIQSIGAVEVDLTQAEVMLHTPPSVDEHPVHRSKRQYTVTWDVIDT